jgi:hypothetical protein
MYLDGDISGYIQIHSGYIRIYTGYIRIYPDTSGIFPDKSGYIRDVSGYIRDISRYIWDISISGYVWIYLDISGIPRLGGTLNSHTCTPCKTPALGLMWGLGFRLG